MVLAELDAGRDAALTAKAVADELGGDLALPMKPGDNVGRYRIVDSVGQGAMGVVYEAVDPKLERRVAVKTLRLSNRNPGAADMLREEARSLGLLQHPNVVPIFDLGRCATGWFIAMEFVDGQPLGTWCRGKPWMAIVDRFIDAARGLAAAHDAGVIHRDFKPANVLVGNDDRARVADFGIATSSSMPGRSHTLDASSSDAPAAHNPGTGTGSLIGTPAYMAPEQLQGRPATARSDQYAFFVALFEALDGTRPFAGANPAALLEQRREGAPKLARDDVPASLVEIIARGLSFEPEARHASMGAVADALVRARKPRFKGWVGVLGAGVVAVAVAVSWSQAAETGCKDAATAFESSWQNEHRPIVDDRWQSELSPSALTRLDQRFDGFVRTWASEYAASCEEVPAVRSAIQRCLERRATDFEAALEVSVAEETPRSKVLAVAIAATPRSSCNDSGSGGGETSLLSMLRSSSVDATLSRARSLYAAGRFSEVTALLSERWGAIERHGTAEQMGWAEYLRALNELYSGTSRSSFERLGVAHNLAITAGADELAAMIGYAAVTWAPVVTPASTEAWVQRALADTKRAGSVRIEILLQLALGRREHARGSLDRADERVAKVQALLDAHPEHEDLTWPLATLEGNIALGRHEGEPAVIAFEVALDRLRAYELAHTSQSLRTRAGLIQALLRVGDVESAGVLLDEYDRVLGPTDDLPTPRLVMRTLLYTAYYEALGDLASSLKELSRLFARIGPEDRNWINTATRLGLAHSSARDYASARNVLERVRVHQESTLGGDAQHLGITLHNLAEAEAGMGMAAQAAEHYREALAIADLNGTDTTLHAFALTGLGEVEFELGEVDAARMHLERSVAMPHDDEAERAEARASLARVLWRLGGDENRVRALRLAEQSMATLSSTAGRDAQALELSRWIETL